MEWLVVYSGINIEDEVEEIKTKIIIADGIVEANNKADKHLRMFDDELYWDVQGVFRLDLVERIE